MAGRRPLSRVVFKTGEPRESELFSLAMECAIDWRTLGEILGLTDQTLSEIVHANHHKVSDKMYAMLTKWKECLGSEASYRALALGLVDFRINRRDLVEKYCHGKDREELFKTGPRGDEELLSLAKECDIDLLSLGWILGPTNVTLTEINTAVSERLDRANHIYTMLKKWMECLRSGASYRALALLLDTASINRRDLIERFCHDKDREELFKIGQPGDEELLSLAKECDIDLLSLGWILGPTNVTLTEISTAVSEGWDRAYHIYTMLKKWKECLRSGASYRALALLLDTASINRRDLIERFCHDEDREEVFKTGQPEDEELLNLAHEIESIWRSFGLLVGLEAPTLTEIDERHPRASDNTHAVLREWKELLGSGATYEALIVLLGDTFINGCDLMERFCSQEEDSEQLFKRGQPDDEELSSLAHDIVSFWRTSSDALCLTTRTLTEIVESPSFNLYIACNKMCGPWASYGALAQELNNRLKNMHHLSKRYCLKKETGRECIFKTGQPGDEELLCLAYEILSTWKSLDMVVNGTTRTVAEIDELHPREEDKPYAMLKKWKDKLGSTASYGALARVLDTALINRRDLVERYCHDRGRVVFKIGQPGYEELRNLAQEFLIDTISPETDREEAFKIGQPEERELFNLADDIVSTFESLQHEIWSVWLGIGTTSPDIEELGFPQGKVCTLLLDWKKSLGSRASYRALARMLNTTIINAHDLVKKYCHREGEFARDQKRFNLDRNVMSKWKPFGMILGLEAPILTEIDKNFLEKSDKMYAMLRKWKESLGFGASYGALADGLENALINRHDLVERFCYDRAVAIRLDRRR